MLDPLPALVEPTIYAVLDDALSWAESATWNVECLSGEAVDEEEAGVDGRIRFYLLETPQVVLGIGVGWSKLDRSLQVHSLVAFLARADPVVRVEPRIVGLHDRKQLTRLLLPELQQNILTVLPQHQTALQVDELEVVHL